MNLQDFRDKIPQLRNLDDSTALDVLQRTYYPSVDRARMAEVLGVKAPEAPVQERSTVRALGDTAVQFGRGAVSGVRMISDLAGADNRVSAGLRSADQALGELLSATAQQDQQRMAEIMQEAEGKGWGEQVMAGLKAASVAPGALMAQAAGSTIPTLLASAVPGVGPAAVAARLGAAGAVGAAQGAGNVKGQIYETTKAELLKAGATPEEAEQRAVQAQEYEGPNAGQIALGGALGAAAGSTGAERAVHALRSGVTRSPAGLAGRVVQGGVAEAVPEALQGGQEKYAGNTALRNEGFDVDPMRGVVAQATLEGAAGLGMGAVTGVPAPKVQADALRAAAMVPEGGPLSRAANAGVEARAQAVEATGVDPTAPTPEAQPEPLDDPMHDRILALPAGARQDALRAYAVLNRDGLPKGVVQYNRKLLDRLLAEGEAQEEAPPPQQPAGPLLLGYDQTPTGVMIAGTDGEARPEIRAEVVNRQQELDRRRDLGLTPDVLAAPRSPVAMPGPSLPAVDAVPETAPEVPRSASIPANPATPGPIPASEVAKPESEVQKSGPPPTQGPFATPDEARAYITDQRRAGGTSFVALPLPMDDGSFGVVTAGHPQFARAEAFKIQQDRAAAGILEGDTLNKLGNPFKTRASALLAAKKAGGEAVPVKGGFVVRPVAAQAQLAPVDSTAGKESDVANPEGSTRAQAEAAPDQAPPPADVPAAGAAPDVPGAGSSPLEAAGVAGQAIDDEWTSFAPESGTRSVPRADMPQIKAEHRGAMVNFLNARGIAHQSEVEIPAADLKPTQAEFSPARVAKAREFTGGDRSILVSSDGYVVDGHHQWLAKLEAGQSVKAIRLDAPIEQLLTEVRQFPSAESADGASPAAPAPGAPARKQGAAKAEADGVKGALNPEKGDPAQGDLYAQQGEEYTATHEHEAGKQQGPQGGRAAHADNGVRRDPAPVSRNPRITALGIAAEIQRAGSAALVGRTVSSPAELAELAQVYRDPRYETFRVFFVKDGTIVHSTGVSARLPGQTGIMPADMSMGEYIQFLKDQLARTGADGYYLLHNHPSGDPTPSRDDVQVTRGLAAQVPGMRGHVVINSNKFAVIRSTSTTRSPMVQTKDFGPDLLLVASKPSPLVGKAVTTTDILAGLGKSLQKPGWVTLVGVDSQLNVRVVADAVASNLTRSPRVLAAMVRRLMRQSGARVVYLVGTDADVASAAVQKGLSTGILGDAVGETGLTQNQRAGGKLRRKAPFGKTPTRTVSEEVKAMEDARPSEEGAPRTLATAVADTLNNVRALQLPAGYVVNDLFQSKGKLHWWHKTVGTQYNLAQRSPEFKPVFDSAQEFINDVAHYASTAADQAPTILPKLESLKDIAKTPLAAADNKAIAAPIFEGTLVWTRDGAGKPVRVDPAADAPAGIVFTPDELRSLFNLTDQQVDLYREFRAAADMSLASMAIADIVRFGSTDLATVREQLLAAETLEQAAQLAGQHLEAMATADPKRAAVLRDTATRIQEKADKARDLMARGYAPLTRYGQHSLDVVDAQGERVYFGLFESKAEANKMARQMTANFPDATVSQGTMSQEEYKLFSGVSPETVELFGEMLGLEQSGDGAADQAFQSYLKLAKANRSAMKRLIHRKGIAGFSEDPGRVLAGFVYSNARQTSSSLHMGRLTEAVGAIPKGQGELKDAAVRLRDYVQNPQEEAQAFRGLLFAQYLGGSIASAVVNTTQPFAVTFPWLSQYGGIAKAAGQMRRAVADVLKKSTGDAELDAALKDAEESGIVSPQEVFQLQAQASGRAPLRAGDGTVAGNAMAAGSNALSKFSLAWGKLFGVAEQFNRRTTFIAAYRTAVEQGMADPAEFAAKAIYETQFVYSKANKPRWARGAIGGTLFTFKQYSVNYLELLHRMATQGGPEGKRAALLALGVLFLLSGAGGVPFAEDVDDLVDGALQRMGYNFSSQQAKQEFFTNLFGQAGAQFVMRGVSGIAGVPIDISGRMGMSNLIPGTGALLKKDDRTRDLMELAGPAGDFAKRIAESGEKAMAGDFMGPRGAVATVLPLAFRNVAKAQEMASTGMYLDTKGKKVLDADGFDAAAKAIGFQPNDVARVQDATFEVQRRIALNKMREAEIAAKWAKGVFLADQGLVADARGDLQDWNTKNPEAPIAIKMPQIIRRVREMRTSKTERIAKTAPSEIRDQVKRELAREAR